MFVKSSGCVDLAGQMQTQATYLSTRSRINHLIDRFLAIDILSDRLSDLPSQFTNPHQRPWDSIDWKQVNADLVIGVDLQLFIQVVGGAAEIEAPVRDYAQESWGYLHAFHLQMASFFYGESNENEGSRIGVWEKEERRHTPVMRKIYAQLTGQKFQPKPNTVAGCQPGADSQSAIYRHLSSRISTEWSAIAVYLWLMAHSTGQLQQAIAQLLQDEVNHLAKFWGFSRWAFGSSAIEQLQVSMQDILGLLKHHKSDRTDGQNVLSAPQIIGHLPHAVELGFTFTRVMVRINRWDKELTQSYLKHLFGRSPYLPNETAKLPILL
jgi:hypothetical protein